MENKTNKETILFTGFISCIEAKFSLLLFWTHPMLLMCYSCLFAQEVTPESGWLTKCGAGGDLTEIGSMQVKHLTLNYFSSCRLHLKSFYILVREREREYSR